jgi:hypothetical protein
MKNVLEKEKIINSKRQPKNLKRFLSSLKFDFHESSPSMKKCTAICFDKMENIVVPWIISSYKRNYIILI